MAAGAAVQLLSSGLLNQAVGAYIVLLQRDFGWSKTSLSAATSLLRLESGLLGPIEGWLVDRFGPRNVMRFGLVVFGVGFMLFSQVDSLPTFYAIFVVMALGATLAGFLPLAVSVVNWFNRRRATALATMQIGFAFGGVIVPVVVWALESFGWRATAFASGVIVLLAGLPLTQLVRHRPEDYGMEVDGGSGPSADAEEEPPDEVSFSPAEALRTPAFWFISLGHGSALLVVSAVSVHLVPHLHEYLGFSLETAGLMMSLLAIMQIVGQLTGGFLGDRFSKRVIAICCMGAHTSGLLILAYASSLTMVVLAIVLHGVAWGMRGPLMQAIRADYFGRGSFALIMGLSSVITTIGNSAGPLVAGVLADATGSYQIGFTILALLAGLGSIFFVLATPPPPPPRLAQHPYSSGNADRIG